VVVKVARPKQDMRFDIPVVGLRTVETLKASGVSVLAVEAEKTLFIEMDEVIKKADEFGIVIMAV
jgi:hypothetical protein